MNSRVVAKFGEIERCQNAISYAEQKSWLHRSRPKILFCPHLADRAQNSWTLSLCACNFFSDRPQMITIYAENLLCRLSAYKNVVFLPHTPEVRVLILRHRL